MKISIYGDIAKQDQNDRWDICEITMELDNDIIKLSIDGAGGQKAKLSINHEMLRYVVETLQNSPDFEDESAELSPD